MGTNEIFDDEYHAMQKMLNRTEAPTVSPLPRESSNSVARLEVLAKPSASIWEINGIEPHPDADRLEIVWLKSAAGGQVRIVTGPHYEVGMLGVYLPPHLSIPGYLAEDLWLVGRASANAWITIETKNMRGIESPGLFCGSRYQPDRKHPFKPWPYWREHWKIGDDVSAYLGVLAIFK